MTVMRMFVAAIAVVAAASAAEAQKSPTSNISLVVPLAGSSADAAARDPDFFILRPNPELVPRGTSPEEVVAFAGGEIVRWPPIFSVTGLKPE